MTPKRKIDPDPFTPVSEKFSQRFLDTHTRFLIGDIDEESIRDIIEWILYENMEEQPEGEEPKVLTLYINSYGGDLNQAFALIDIMNCSRYPIATVGIGAVMSAAFMIFSCGNKGLRFIGKNTSIMCHQFSSGSDGKYHDIKAMTKENDSMNSRMLQTLCASTGLSERTIKSKLLGPTDVWLTPQEMVDLRIADRIL